MSNWGKFSFGDANLTRILEQVSACKPLVRIATLQEIAKSALFLASENASFLTGADLQVESGLAQI
ncbi:MAG: SDR family oxidoreductase [Gammaproteobacteria bacterium]|nr:SDR family oxidoreductase [Gammaproteobacteria bacterium]MBU2179312.1 SDR family oxidoreductase [Gammaproteobacteria bacterium]MBU2278486.1 SDR family oxidoreductase [Gammaproteobacteria bacterium]